MIIEESDFKLMPISEDSPLFDLELLYIINEGKDNQRTEFKPAGYGLTLYGAIKRIAHYKICCKHRDEAIKLFVYFKEYKKELENLKNLLDDEKRSC